MASLTADQIEDIEQRLRSGAYRDDPRAVFTPLRESAPVYFSKAWQAWLITRHADVEQALRDTETFTSTGRLEKLLEPLDPKLREAVAPLIGHFSAGLQHSDPPEHTRIHGLVNRALAPAVVNRMRDVIQSFVDGLLDPLLASGRMDLVRDFAEPLPVQVLGHVLGFTREECERFRHWDDDQVAVLGSRSGRPELVPQARRSVDSMVGWLRQVTEVRRANPRDDLFSKLVAGLDAGTLRNEPELHGTYNAVLIGGHETTTGLISSAIMLLVRHPDQLERLRADSSL
ncbi:MAG: hypothetical protein CMJ18_09520, partial [Phycisphaeraceae bacterium]|nr:hypothetical protein [Phycisphaeraceae bacterium]